MYACSAIVAECATADTRVLELTELSELNLYLKRVCYRIDTFTGNTHEYFRKTETVEAL